MRGSWIAVGCAALALAGSLAWMANRGAPSAAAPALPVRADDTAATQTPPTVREPSAAMPDAEGARASVPAELALALATSSTSIDRATLTVTALAKEDGAPLEGIWILLGPEPPENDLGPFSTSAQRSNRWLTDASGRIEASVPAERKVRLMTRSERAPAEVLSIEPLAIGEMRAVELRLTTRSDLHFVARVVADEDGSPLPGAWATVGDVDQLFSSGDLASLLSKGRGGSKSGAAGPTRIAVDAVGVFEVDAASWQDGAARVEAPGHAPQLVPFTAGHESRAAALEVRLARSGALDVLVLDPERAPLKEVRIQLAARAHQIVAPAQTTLGLDFSMQQVAWEARTGPEGRARLEGLPPRVALELHATPQHGPTQIQAEQLVLEPEEVRSLEITIRSGGVLAGWLRKQDGSPVPDAEIWMKTRGELRFIAFESHEKNEVRKARTDAQGRFEFKKVTDGAWIVGTAPSASSAPSVVEVLVKDGAADRDVLLSAWDELYVRGVVLDPTGQPCEARVVARSDANSEPVSAKADAQGAFALGPLAPGSYELVATAGYKADNRSANSLPVRASAGDSGVTISLRAGCALAGRVVDSVKRSAVEAQVTISQVGGDLALMATTSQSGTFEFGALEPGVYDLVAVTTGGNCGVIPGVRLDAGQSSNALELAVEPGGRLRVHYDGSAESAKIQIEHEGVRIVWGKVSRGASRDWLVPAGKNLILCTEALEARPITNEVTVTAGQLTEVRF